MTAPGRNDRVINTQDIFHAALLPGAMFLALCLALSWFAGRSAAQLPKREPLTAGEALLAAVTLSLLIVLLGGVTFGYFYAVEAAAMGAFALLVTGLVADRYLAVWNEADPARRRALMAQTWSADGRYVDPLMSGEGREGVATMIEAARGQFPGHGFTLRGQPDGHGRYVRFSWTLSPNGGAPVAAGADVVTLDEHGRIADVIGFLDGSTGHA